MATSKSKKVPVKKPIAKKVAAKKAAVKIPTPAPFDITQRPLPASLRSTEYNGVYPFGAMKPGDCFPVVKNKVVAVRSSASWYRRRYDKFSSFTVRFDHGAGSHYCYRLS